MQNKTNIPVEISAFKKIIWDFYTQNGRLFDWRHVDDPYKVLISEIMLQQTQTQRVINKYAEFLAQFPTIKDLADAPLRDVLVVWQGLGYNRRGKFLHQTAQAIVKEHDATVPACVKTLATFPGIGMATASSICAFAFNIPTVFIETNIRTVFIQFFFAGQEKVNDADILPLVAQTVDATHARDWYYALMDYGVFLKKNMPNPSRKSKHYAVQSRFEGSNRQVRGMVLKLLTKHSALSMVDFYDSIEREHTLIEKIVSQLCAEGMIIQKDMLFSIT